MGSKKSAKKSASKSAKKPAKPTKVSKVSKPVKAPKPAATTSTIMPAIEPEAERAQLVLEAQLRSAGTHPCFHDIEVANALAKTARRATEDPDVALLHGYLTNAQSQVSKLESELEETRAAEVVGGEGSEFAMADVVSAAVKDALEKANADFVQQIESFSAELHAALNAPEEKDIVEHAREVREERDRLRDEPKGTTPIKALLDALRKERDAVAEALGAPKSVFDLAAYAATEAALWRKKLEASNKQRDDAQNAHAEGHARFEELRTKFKVLEASEALATSFRMMYAVDFDFDNLPDNHKVFVEAAAEVIEAEVRAAQRAAPSA